MRTENELARTDSRSYRTRRPKGLRVRKHAVGRTSVSSTLQCLDPSRPHTVPPPPR
jgi:hypothetical protein